MNEWFAADVHYYDERKDALILDCVRPVLAGLRGDVAEAFFVRHWRQGPHLRLRFLTTADVFEARVMPTLIAEVGAYLEAHPSSTPIDAERMLPTYRRLAEQEME